MEYANPEDVRDEKPNLELFRQWTLHQAGQTQPKCVLDLAITAQAAAPYDCISRYFAPANGIQEDPVTGSIHTAIAPLWAEKLGKKDILAYQASARGGKLYCELLENERIEISGYAKLYMQAELHV